MIISQALTHHIDRDEKVWCVGISGNFENRQDLLEEVVQLWGPKVKALVVHEWVVFCNRLREAQKEEIVEYYREKGEVILTKPVKLLTQGGDKWKGEPTWFAKLKDVGSYRMRHKYPGRLLKYLGLNDNLMDEQGRLWEVGLVID